jgi:DsbC/DsbD-like thiol-disulfide interchange protein
VEQPPATTPAPVTVRVNAEPGASPGMIRLVAEITVQPGYHVYAEPVPPGFTPLAIVVREGAAEQAGPAQWPPPERLVVEDFPEEFWVFHGQVTGWVPLRLTAPPPLVLRGEVIYQACTEFTCFMPAAIPFELQLS